MRSNIRRSVIVGLVAAQLVTVLVIYLTSGRISADAEQDHTVALLETSAAEAVDHTREYLAPAGSLVATAADMIEGGVIDPSALERAFLGELQRSPQLSGVYIGGDDGSFFFVARENDGFVTKTIDMTGGERRVTTWTVTAAGERGPVEIVTDDDFDPRLRPWFQDAARAETTAVEWTPPYVFFTSRQLGVSASAAVETGDGMLAVIGADIELESLSGFLGSLRIGSTGEAVIVDAANTVIAHPDADLLAADTGPGPNAVTSPVQAAELDDPRARAVIGALIQAGSDPTSQSATFSGPDAEGTVAFRTLDVGQQQWTVAVHAEDGALVQPLADARGRERFLMIVVGALSIVLLGVVALPVTRSLATLERRATLDALTGLLNRGTILDQGEQIARSRDLHAAIMIDLDRFKSINDTHGHQVGDEVIHAVGQRITGALRGGDRAGRVGGEEFLVVIGDTTPTNALEMAERIHQAIRSTPIGTTVGPLAVTASLGLGVAVGPAELQRTLAVADTALLEAKHRGRDCVVSGGMASEMPRTSRSPLTDA